MTRVASGLARDVLLRILALAVAGVVSACGGGGSGGDDARSRVLAAVRLSDGNEQSTTVGTELTQPIVAQLLNAAGEPIPGYVVNFKVTAGGGSVFAGAASSDADGVVRERWTLGTVAGPQRVEVRAIDPNGVAVVYAAFDAVAVAGPPAALAAVAGDAQFAQQLQPVPTMLKVAVRDAYGNAIAGAVVSFDAAGGSGSASPASVATNVLGEASTRWTLGTTLGQQVLTASVAGVPSIAFGAIASQAAPGPAVQMQLISGNSLTVPQHLPLAEPLVVKVLDALGNGVPGVAVDFAPAPGSGVITTVTILTDAGGLAAWNGYFHTPGTQQLVASAAGAPAVTFTEQVTPSSHPFDGVYLFHCLPLTTPNAPPGPAAICGQLLLTGTQADRFPLNASNPPQPGALDEATGTLHALVSGMLLRTLVDGTLALNANGNVTGSGTVTLSEPNRTEIIGTWTVERL